MSIEVAIQKRFGKRFSLDVSFVTHGQCLGILGPSGCGKSMTLKCIAGIEKPDSGFIRVNGQVLFDSTKGVNVRPQRRRVGYLFQDYALFPRMTIAQNIAIGVSGSDKVGAVWSLLKRFHLDGLDNQYPDQLSGGQRQRTAIARMLAASPEVILLDEPFAALDSHLREYMQIEMKSILAEYSDTVMVTHNRDEAFKLCGGLLVLGDGKILGHGPTRELFATPRSLAVAAITGCKNFSRAEKSGGFSIRALDWGVELVTRQPVPDGLRHVGIRAHDVIPCDSSDFDIPNLVKVEAQQILEDCFEWNVLFTIQRREKGNTSHTLWWKYSKRLIHDMPCRIQLPPESLLLLTGDDYCSKG